MLNRGTLYIISAPSGAGKTSLVKALLQADRAIQVSVSYTTRPIRSGEQDGVDYHFVSHQQFEQMLESQEFLEHANVFGNYYGTSKTWVNQQIEQGRDVILEIDWQGAEQVRGQISDAIGIFILPPSKHTLEQRLVNRGQDDTETIAKRMAQAANEISHYDEFDYIVINDEFDTALNNMRSIVNAQRVKFDKQGAEIKNFVAGLLS